MKLQPSCHSLRELRVQYETFCFISKALIGLPTCIFAVTLRTLLVALKWQTALDRWVFACILLFVTYFFPACLNEKNSYKNLYNYVSQPTAEIHISVFRKLQQKQTCTQTYRLLGDREDNDSSLTVLMYSCWRKGEQRI